jgi:AcrR family transcriptional regulator
MPEERPRQILCAALAVFAERGLAAARLEDIAKRAGLSKGTIYLYFPNKEELFRGVIRQTVVSRIEAGERQASERAGSATAALERFVRDYWAFVRSPEFAPVFRLVLGEIQNFPDLAQFYAQEVVARGHRLVVSLIQNGIETGEFRDLDPSVAARMLMAPVAMHGFWCSHRECFTAVAKKTDSEVLDEILQFYLHAIRANAPAEPAPRGPQQ